MVKLSSMKAKTRKNPYGCDHCGKGVQFANKVSHAKNRTKIIRRPNLHAARVLEAGVTVKRNLCTKCLHKADRPVFYTPATA